MTTQVAIPDPAVIRRPDSRRKPEETAQELPDDASAAPMTSALWWLVLVLLPLLLHVAVVQPDEPIFGGDSNRHVMTSVFFRDLLVDGDMTHPKQYAEQYFEQYPALGLLIWPPFFHGVAGLVMTVFGTSVVVPRMVVLAFHLIAVAALYGIVSRRFDARFSQIVALVFAISPLVFEYSRYVMLETPALALCLVSLHQFDAWLHNNRRRCLVIAALMAAFAALTRFDAAILLPTYLLAIAFHRSGDKRHAAGSAPAAAMGRDASGDSAPATQESGTPSVSLPTNRWSQLLQRDVIISAVLALAVVAPPYAVILKEAGGLHLQQASQSVGLAEDEGDDVGFLHSRNFFYYPSCLPEQMSWPVTIFFVAGLLVSLKRPLRQKSGLFWALLLATYLLLTPLAELRSRHAIYWVPAVAFFATLGAAGVAAWCQQRMPASVRKAALIAVYGLLIVSPAVASWSLPEYRVTGYRQAAEFVLQHSQPGSRVFFDGWWDGNFTYHMRSLDASRSRTVIRGDRLLYDFTCVPDTDFQQYVETSGEILAALSDADVEFLVLEQPQFFQKVEIAEQLRNVVAEHPERFERVASFPVQSTMKDLPAFSLEIYSVRK
ncbi:MAG: glycosyltransferase family 39 protein [Planctomycetaceae bacterium]